DQHKNERGRLGEVERYALIAKSWAACVLVRCRVHCRMQHAAAYDIETGGPRKWFERETGDGQQDDKGLKTKNAMWIYTKDPNVQAFSDLMNRAIDKPAEHVQVEGAGSITIRWQTGESEKESGEVLELSEDERIRNARKVNGHVDNGES